MKMLIAAAALAAALGAPALATAQEAYASDAPIVTYQARAARAQAIPTAQPVQSREVLSLPSEVQIQTPYDIFVAGEYVGADPDPNVRLQMTKDFVQAPL